MTYIYNPNQLSYRCEESKNIKDHNFLKFMKIKLGGCEEMSEGLPALKKIV